MSKDKQFKWDIESIYANEKSFHLDVKRLYSKVKTFQKYRTKKLESKNMLMESLKSFETIERKAEKIYVYARMKRDEDLTDDKKMKLFNVAMKAMAEISEGLAYYPLKLQALNKVKVKKILESEKSLSKYKFFFQNIFLYKKHSLSEKEEEILSSLSEIISASSNIFDILTDGDFEFDEIKHKGKTIKVTNESYGTLLTKPDRELRKKAYESLYKEYKKFVNTLSATYTTSVKKNIVLAKKRKHNSVLERALESDNVDKSIYKSLIGDVHKTLPTLKKYLNIRKEILNVDRLNHYDLYVPLFKEPNVKIPFTEAVEIITNALSPLGEEYIDIVRKGIKERWIDVYPRDGKSSGAYSFGSYDSKPFILLNYDNKLRDVFTLIHEMGHSMHSYYTRKCQPYIYGGHSIMTAETASTVNELLLIKYLIKNSKNKGELKYFINTYLEGFRTTLIRQTMFAEFEMEVYENIERGLPPSRDFFMSKYTDLIKKYFGNAVELDDNIIYEWARIPHFYRPFYVYKYATGYSNAVIISEKLLNEKGYNKKYIDFLKSGDKDYPLNLLKQIGVDYKKDNPVLGALTVFKELTNELGRIVK